MTKEEAKILMKALDKLDTIHCTLEGLSNDLYYMDLRGHVTALQQSIFMHIPKEFIDYGTEK